QIQSQPAAPPVIEFVDDGVSLPDEATFARLAQTDSPTFLEMCMRRYRREVHTVSGEMHKQERIAGKLYPEEAIDFWFREEPYSVLIKWKQGARQACASMYVEGENGNKVLALPTLLRWSGKLLERDPDCCEAKAASRYSLRESSLLQGTERTWQAWKTARDNGTLHVEYKGIVAVPELGGRRCHVLKRTCETPEGDGVATVEIAVDAQTWLQTGSTLTDKCGNLIGKYMFPQVVVNPEFSPTLFTKDSVRK
ncbi:MAG: DUF1571 domain-containing protein, partial [Gemmataceae bacterium]